MNKKIFKKYLNWTLDLIFPGFCPLCRNQAFADGEHYSCLSCLDELPWVTGTRCELCGIPMAGIDFRGLSCMNCREENLSFESGRCMMLLDVKGKNLIHEMKYHGVKDVIRDFPAWVERSPGFVEHLVNSILIPVPLHPKRLQSRGFNQSQWIAEAMMRETRGSSEVYDCLRRTKNTPTQTKFDRSERKKNVKNAFALKPGNCLDRENRIVLVDDVYTTGATLNACADTLVGEGFNRISVATLGHG